MAMDQKQRNENLSEKRKKVAEKELRHRVRPGIEKVIARIKERSGGMEASEMIQLALMKMDLMGDEELAEFLKYPRHEIIVSESVAQDIYDHGIRSIMNNPDRDESDEIERPAA